MTSNCVICQQVIAMLKECNI